MGLSPFPLTSTPIQERDLRLSSQSDITARNAGPMATRQSCRKEGASRSHRRVKHDLCSDTGFSCGYLYCCSLRWPGLELREIMNTRDEILISSAGIKAALEISSPGSSLEDRYAIALFQTAAAMKIIHENGLMPDFHELVTTLKQEGAEQSK